MTRRFSKVAAITAIASDVTANHHLPVRPTNDLAGTVRTSCGAAERSIRRMGRA